MIRTTKIISHSADETKSFGKHLARYFKGGIIVCLFGDLGSGKTTLIKGIAEGLKINQRKVHSPTFVLMNVYEGRLTLFHFDLYRLDLAKALHLKLDPNAKFEDEYKLWETISAFIASQSGNTKFNSIDYTAMLNVE